MQVLVSIALTATCSVAATLAHVQTDATGDGFDAAGVGKLFGKPSATLFGAMSHVPVTRCSCRAESRPERSGIALKAAARSAITRKYEKEGHGFPPYHQRMMVTLLLYSYCVGVYSSRRIQKRCERDAAYRVIVGDDVPNFRTISDFRKLHLPELQGLFVEVVRLNGIPRTPSRR